MKLIEWINGVTKLGKATMDEFQNNIKEAFNNVDNKMNEMSAFPIGASCQYYGITPPEDFMFMDGAEISRSEYAKLFEIFGGENSPYGLGDGKNTFNLPDLRECVPAMYKEGSANFGTLGSKIGSAERTLNIANLPPHDHQMPYMPNSTGSLKTAYSYGIAQGSATDTGNGNGNGGNLGTAKTGSGTPISIIQPTFICNYIIKVK